MRISDWCSDVGSSDLRQRADHAAGIFDDMAGAARRADPADDREDHVLGTDAVAEAALDADFHRLRLAQQQRLGREQDRKSTRLTPVTNAHLECRLLLVKKNKYNYT